MSTTHASATFINKLQEAVRQHYLRHPKLNSHLHNVPLNDMIEACAEEEEFEAIMAQLNEQERIQNTVNAGFDEEDYVDGSVQTVYRDGFEPPFNA